MRLRKVLLICLMLYLALLPAVVWAAPEDPADRGTGLSYDAIRVEVLAVNPHVVGEIGVIVVQSRWSDLSYVAPNTSAGTAIVHWPRAENDHARAVDASTFFSAGERGLSIISYRIPPEILLPDEQSVTATVELRLLAISVVGWPSFGWGSTDFPVAIGRAD